MSDERLDAIDTRWSLVRQAHAAGQSASAAEARGILVMRYASAIRRYVGGIVKDRDETEEVAQDVMVRLLKGDFAGADPTRGRFRDLLKTAVRNMVRNRWAKQQRRQMGPLDIDPMTDSTEAEVEASWLAAWRQSVLDHAWAALQDFERAHPQNPAHTLLRLRTEFPNETSAQLADRLSQKLGTPVQPPAVRQALRRARLRFTDLLVLEVARGLEDAAPAQVEDELAALGLLEHVRDFLPED